MNDDIPDFFEVESLEQMRALADELRLRIVEALQRHAMTVTQVGVLLGVAPAKIHYHVRELERVGLVKLVETREKGGILEKYYRTVAKTLNVPPALLQSESPDAFTHAATEFLHVLTQGYLRSLAAAMAQQRLDGPDVPVQMIAAGQVWMTPDEIKQALNQVRDLFKPYQVPRGLPGEQEITLANIVFQAQSSPPGVQRSRAINSDESDQGRDEAKQ